MPWALIAPPPSTTDDASELCVENSGAVIFHKNRLKRGLLFHVRSEPWEVGEASRHCSDMALSHGASATSRGSWERSPRCSIHHRLMAVFTAGPSEGPKLTDSRCWFTAAPPCVRRRLMMLRIGDGLKIPADALLWAVARELLDRVLAQSLTERSRRALQERSVSTHSCCYRLHGMLRFSISLLSSLFLPLYKLLWVLLTKKNSFWTLNILSLCWFEWNRGWKGFVNPCTVVRFIWELWLKPEVYVLFSFWYL